MQATFLGIDIGTSGVKVVATDDTGAVLAQSTAPLSVARPQPGWSEQDPAAWWTATDAAVRGLPPAVRCAARCIGLAGQMHGATVLDAADRPLRPAILWNDGRSAEQCAELEAVCPASRAITGNRAMPGFTAPKLLWLAANEPDVFAAIRTVLLPKDYVRLMMSGDRATDASDASGTLWLDVGRRRWSGEMLAATRLDERYMPALHEGPDVTGTLRREVAQAWGMECVPIAAGAGDNAAGAVGVGVAAEGQALLSLGTSGVVFAATREHRPNVGGAVHAFCHCLPQVWHQMSVILSAAACVDWGVRLTGATDPAAFFALAEAAGIDDGPELFLPYLSGERTPHNDARMRGALTGLNHDTSPGRIAQAILEGVAFALADGLDAIADAGTPVSALRAIGGGSRSTHWSGIIAAALDRPLEVPLGGEIGPSLGASRLARLALGGDAAAAALDPPALCRIVEPEPNAVDRLAGKRRRFQAALPAARIDRLSRRPVAAHAGESV